MFCFVIHHPSLPAMVTNALLHDNDPAECCEGAPTNWPYDKHCLTSHVSVVLVVICAPGDSVRVASTRGGRGAEIEIDGRDGIFAYSVGCPVRSVQTLDASPGGPAIITEEGPVTYITLRADIDVQDEIWGVLTVDRFLSFDTQPQEIFP